MEKRLNIDIRPEHLEVVRQMLALYAFDREVWAFGSRVRGDARPTSDLDLVIMGDESLPLQAMAMLRTNLSESDLPMKVDILEWATASEAFRAIIRQSYVILKKADQKSTE